MSVSSAAPAPVFFSNEVACITVVPTEYLVLSWTGKPVDSAGLRLVYEKLLRALINQGLGNVLTDHRQLPRLHPADRDWLTNDWAPRAVREAGYRFTAIVQSEDVFNRLAMVQVVHDLNVPLTVRMFLQEDEAVAWLRQQR